jgi:peptidoglycan/xylan/chitin deacetylase (PgdA/CDA1 family)
MKQPAQVLLAATAGTITYLAGRRTVQSLRDLHRRRQPVFYYRTAAPDELGVPVFSYHSIAGPETPDSITPAAFEAHLAHLARNGYTTITADALRDHLIHHTYLPERAIMLTFDDGRATLWTVAYPLLKCYGMTATAFIVPGMMPESGIRPTLRNGHTPDALNADLNSAPTITWEEAQIMHDSGVIDFQSHTLHHALIPCSPTIVDFIRPGFRFGYHNFAVPLLDSNGSDRLNRIYAPGTPVYASQPRLSAARRFFDDPGLREMCVTFVREQGGEAFFTRPDWWQTLQDQVAIYRHTHTLTERFESPEEQVAAISNSLHHSKALIEAHLPDHRVHHLCYPWHRYSITAASLAREVGYDTAFIDINPQKPHPNWNDPYPIQPLLPTNDCGDDPYQITRIDSQNMLPLSLPGKGRLSFWRRFWQRFWQRLGFLQRRV